MFLFACVLFLCRLLRPSRTVTEKPWVGWLLSSLTRLITLSAQWWSCLQIIYDSSTVPLVPVSKVIIRCVLNWQIISDPHPSFSIIFFCFKIALQPLKGKFNPLLQVLVHSYTEYLQSALESLFAGRSMQLQQGTDTKFPTFTIDVFRSLKQFVL